MGEGKGSSAGDDAGACEGAFAEVVGINVVAADGPEECGAGFDVGGLNGGGEGVSFFEGAGRGAEFVGGSGDGAIGNGNGGLCDGAGK